MALITVLLIAAETVTREALCAILQQEPGVESVVEATTLDEAIELLATAQPDVVILELAYEDDRDLIPSIRGAWSAARVIVLVPKAESRQVLGALHAGADGIVLRRAANDVILDAVRAVQTGGNFMCGSTSSILIRDYVRRWGSLGVADPLHRLSRRERQVLEMVVNGMTSSEIGRQLAISPKSVDTYRGRLMSKIGVGNVPELVKFAMQNGLVNEQLLA